MGKLVNLRRVRKSKARSEAEKRAAANRTKFGVSKAVRAQATAETDRTKCVAEAHKLEKE